jgi:hypothetical protein
VTTIQIVNTVLILSLGPLIAACYVLAQLFIQRLPTAQRAALEQFARMAVRYVMRQPEQLNQSALAKAYMSDLFRLSGLPTPHEDILEIAIGAAFYELEQHG